MQQRCGTKARRHTGVEDFSTAGPSKITQGLFDQCQRDHRGRARHVTTSSLAMRAPSHSELHPRPPSSTFGRTQRASLATTDEQRLAPLGATKAATRLGRFDRALRRTPARWALVGIPEREGVAPPRAVDQVAGYFQPGEDLSHPRDVIADFFWKQSGI
jgi:hypothetical protein